MSPFLWFAIILTVVYVIYYAVTIMKDLYGKQGEANSNVEELDSPDNHPGDEDKEIPEEQPIPVTETPDGFMVNGSEVGATLVPAVNDSVKESPPVEKEEAEIPKPSPAKSYNENLADKFEEIEPAFSDTYYIKDFTQALLNGGQGHQNQPKILVISLHDEL